MPEDAQVPNLLGLKIIKDGKPVDISTIGDYDLFIASLMQTSITANIAKIRQYIENRTSAGKTQNFPLNITPTIQEVQCIQPSQSLYITNDGPGQIFVAINVLGMGATPLLINEALSIDFETHQLERFYVWSAAGTVATARAVTAF